MAVGNGNEKSGLEADYARCAEITRRSSSNFYYAFMLLPGERRRALHAVYAFGRFIDDIADDETISDAASMLSRWRAELDRVYGGEPTRAISRALADSARHFTIPRRLLRRNYCGRRDGPHAQTLRELRGPSALLLSRRIRGGPHLH